MQTLFTVRFCYIPLVKRPRNHVWRKHLLGFPLTTFTWGKMSRCGAWAACPQDKEFVGSVTSVRGWSWSRMVLRKVRQHRGAVTHPRTGIPVVRAACRTWSHRCKLSSMEQLVFFLVKSSEAAPNTDTSLAPAATCQQPGEFLSAFFSLRNTTVAKTLVLQ